MEIEKLYNVILDLQHEEEEDKISGLLTDLQTAINTTQTTPDQANSITQSRTDLMVVLQHSKVNTYSSSNMKILHEIGAYNFFGEGAVVEISNILSANAYNAPLTYQSLQDYSKKRASFLSTISQLIKNLSTIGTYPHYYNDNTYEIGLLLPDDASLTEIPKLIAELKDWNNLLRTLSEITGAGVEDAKISYLNNGTLQFFTETNAGVALLLIGLFERLLTLYKRIMEIKLLNKKYKELGIPKAELKYLNDFEKGLAESEIEQLAKNFIKEHAKKTESGRKNEFEIAVKSHIKFLLKALEKGVLIEVTPPEIDENEENEEENLEKDTKESKQLENENKKAVELIKAKTGLIKELTTTLKEVKLLGEGLTDIPDNSNNSDELDIT